MFSILPSISFSINASMGLAGSFANVLPFATAFNANWKLGNLAACWLMWRVGFWRTLSVIRVMRVINVLC